MITSISCEAPAFGLSWLRLQLGLPGPVLQLLLCFFKRSWPSSRSYRLLKVPLYGPDRKIIALVRSGGNFSYVVGFDDKVRLTPRTFAKAPDPLVSLVIQDTAPGSSEHLIVKEAGHFSYDSKARIFKMDPTYKFQDSSEEELVLLRKAFGDESSLIRHPAQGVPRSKMFDCNAIYAAQRAGKNFIWDSLIANNIVLGVTQAVLYPERFFDPSQYDLIVSEFVSSNTFTAVRSVATKYIALSSSSYLSRLGSRAVVGWVGGEVSAVTGAWFLSEHSGMSGAERSRRIKEFNQYYWMLPALIKNDFIDKTILEYLPRAAHRMCLDGVPLRIFVSPRTFRIVTGALTQVIYLKSRDLVVGN